MKFFQIERDHAFADAVLSCKSSEDVEKVFDDFIENQGSSGSPVQLTKLGINK